LSLFIISFFWELILWWHSCRCSLVMNFHTL
jgi:hypothetical protein